MAYLGSACGAASCDGATAGDGCDGMAAAAADMAAAAGADGAGASDAFARSALDWLGVGWASGVISTATASTDAPPPVDDARLLLVEMLMPLARESMSDLNSSKLTRPSWSASKPLRARGARQRGAARCPSTRSPAGVRSRRGLRLHLRPT